MRKTTSPSDLNKRIDIQSYTDVADGMGGSIRTWATAHAVWAAIWPVSANEMIAANAPTMIVSHRIRIRYCSDWVSAKDRIKYGTRYFSIVGITSPNEGKEWLDLLTKEAS